MESYAVIDDDPLSENDSDSDNGGSLKRQLDTISLSNCKRPRQEQPQEDESIPCFAGADIHPSLDILEPPSNSDDDQYAKYHEMEALLCGLNRRTINHTAAFQMAKANPHDAIMIAYHASFIHPKSCYLVTLKDEKESTRLWKVALDRGLRAMAESGNPYAQAFLGLSIFYWNQDEPKNYVEAFDWFSKASKDGSCLAFMYENAYGVDLDVAAAAKLYEKAALRGDATAQCRMGSLHRKGQGVEKSFSKAVEWYVKAANQGDAFAENKLGHMYEEGQGVAKDYSQAKYWYGKAADKGLGCAQYKMGRLYSEGRGVARDELISEKWYKMAFQSYSKTADQGVAHDQYKLGRMYHEGNGVRQDYSKALEYYNKAVEQHNRDGSHGGNNAIIENGLANAHYRLGRMYQKGEGVDQDYQKALHSYEKSIESYVKAGESRRVVDSEGRLPRAQYRMGRMYEMGYGVVTDHGKAFEWYSKAAELDDSDSQYLLGIFYYNGLGVDQDYAKAFEYYLMAAKKGLARAQCMVGCCYRDGHGVNLDDSLALEWLCKAAQQGSGTALRELERRGVHLVFE